MTEFQPTPQTHEQVDEGLRNAFRQAIKDGVMDATPYLKQMTKYQPKPQTLEQKFEEIPELLDQVDALMEFYPLPTAVWRDIKKLMILSYDKGYSRGGYDTHMKYAGTD
jgi:hypothetical protein